MLIGYSRISTDEQSLALQRDAVAAAGCEKVYEDKISDARAERPGLALALDVARGFVARIGGVGRLSPIGIPGHAMRTYSGRPISDMRFRTSAAIATSVAWRPSVRAQRVADHPFEAGDVRLHQGTPTSELAAPGPPRRRHLGRPPQARPARSAWPRLRSGAGGMGAGRDAGASLATCATGRSASTYAKRGRRGQDAAACR